jgi:hypothetical protein
MLRRVMNLLACWKGRVGLNDFKIIWNLIISCLMWCTREKGILEILMIARR